MRLHLLISLLLVGGCIPLTGRSSGLDEYSMTFLTGTEMKQVLPFLVQQRIEAYRPYPYLYEGSIKQEQEWLSWHMQVPQAACAVAYCGYTPVGFILGIPLVAYEDYFTGSIELFRKHGKEPNQYYYITDIIILPEHQGNSLVTRLLELVEQYCKDLGFTYACFVSECYTQHSLKPRDYVELDSRWIHLGYQKTGMVIYSSWNTIQPVGSSRDQAHELPYWIKAMK